MTKKQSVKYAMNSMEMEGFVYTEEEKALFARLANGEIGPEEIDNYVAKKIAAWKKESPESFAEEN